MSTQTKEKYLIFFGFCDIFVGFHLAPHLRIGYALRDTALFESQPMLLFSAKKRAGRLTCPFFGGDGGIRTHDPYVANVMLSQLSYTPKYHTLKLYHKLFICQYLFSFFRCSLK